MRSFLALGATFLLLANAAGTALGQDLSPEQREVNDRETKRLLAEGVRQRNAEDSEGALRTFAQMRSLCDLAIPANAPFCHVWALNETGVTHQKRKDLQQAEASYRAAEALARTHVSPDHELVGAIAISLGLVIAMQGRWTESEPLFRAALPFARPQADAHPLSRGFIQFMLADSLIARGQFADAATLLEEAVPHIRQRTDIGGRPQLLRSLFYLSLARRNLKRLGEADAALAECLTMQRMAGETQTEFFALTLLELALLRAAQERLPETEEPLHQALALWLTLHGEQHAKVALILFLQGKNAFVVRQYEEAETLERRSLSIYRALKLDGSANAISAAQVLAAIRSARAGQGLAPAAADAPDPAARELALNYEHDRLMQEGKLAATIAVNRERVALLTAIHGASATQTISLRVVLANELVQADQLRDADAVISTALADLGQQRIPVIRGRIWNTIGLIRWRAEKLPEAEQAFRYALGLPLNIDTQAEAGLLIETLLANLGAVVRRQGRYPEAIALGEQSVAMARKLYGEEHVQTASSLHLLGNAYGLALRHAEAADMRRRALDIRLRLLGDRNYHTIYSLMTVAADRQEAGDLTGAEELALRALAAAGQLHGADTPLIAEVLDTLAGLRIAQGRYAEAKAALEQALAVYRQAHGDSHGSVANTRTALAGLARFTGQPADAEKLRRQALAAAIAQYGDKHPIIANQQTRLAALLIERAKLTEARELLTASMTILRAVHGDESPALTDALFLLARMARLEGNADLAAIHSSRAVALLDKAGMGDRPGTAFARFGLADALLAQGKVAEAAAAVAAANTVLAPTQLAETPGMIGPLRTTALVALADKRPQDAAVAIDRALDLTRRFLRADGVDYGAMLNDRGLAAARQGEHVQALVFYQDALTAMEKAGLGNHLFAAIILRNTAVSQDVLLRKPAAQRSRARAQEILKNYLFVRRVPDRWT